MAKFRNDTKEPLYFAGVGVVGAGEVSPEVPDQLIYRFTASSNCSPVGKASQAFHDKAAEEEAVRVAAEDALRAPVPGPE